MEGLYQQIGARVECNPKCRAYCNHPETPPRADTGSAHGKAQGGRIPRPQSVQRVLTTGWSVATTRLMIEPSSKSLRSQTLAGPQICVNRGDRPSCVQWAKLGLSNQVSSIKYLRLAVLSSSELFLAFLMFWL